MKITCISDLHGSYPELPGGDLLIIAGDLTARDKIKEYEAFVQWLNAQQYRKKIVIGGNHDVCLEREGSALFKFADCEYLCDSGTEFEGLRIWGSPYTAAFEGMNPHCAAFTEPFGCDTDYWLGDHWQLIPRDIDILITHSPPYGILDTTIDGYLVGSGSLLSAVLNVRPKLHVFGHIHEGYGDFMFNDEIHFINASLMNVRYKPENKPYQIEVNNSIVAQR